MMTSERILDRYDAAAIRGLFAEAGALRALEQRGFHDLDVEVQNVAGIPHVRLWGSKSGGRHALIDAIVVATLVEPARFAARGYAMARPLELVTVHWLREEDPTAAFCAARPALPLQQHPGLGVLRRAFRVVVRMARELGKDGVACAPKLYHDAALFHRSRLFLFLDGIEQGRFEALARDLGSLPLGDASLAVAGGCVRDREGDALDWRPGLQVLPLSAVLAAYFHSSLYSTDVARGFAQSFTWDAGALAATRAALALDEPRRESA